MTDHAPLRNEAPKSDKTGSELRALRDEVVELREAVVRHGNKRLTEWGATGDGALNLAYYLALRNHELRALQLGLARLRTLIAWPQRGKCHDRA